MAAAACPMPKPNLFPIMLIIVFAILATGVYLGTHATAHSTAEAVRNCNRDNIGLVLFNPTTKRTATLCEFSPNQWGRMITEELNGVTQEVTSFADASRPAQNSLQHAIKNLLRQGYTEIRYMQPGLQDQIIQILTGG